MGLPSTGSISMSQVNTELKKSATAVISLNDNDVRKLAGKSSGTINMGDLRGKKASENVTNYQVYSNSWSGYKITGNYSFDLPHKVISGELIVKVTTDNVYSYSKRWVSVLGTTITENETKTISVPIGTTKISGQYYTGGSTSGTANEPRPRTVKLNITFTGEWEA